MSASWRELIVPGLTLGWLASYWVQLEGAPRAARLVPQGVMALLTVLLAVIVLRAFVARRDPAAVRPGASEPAPGSPLRRYWKESAFVALSIGYWGLFQYVGFHVANAVFLVCALLVTGAGPLAVVLATGLTWGSIWLLAQVMNFNLPTPILFR